MDFISVLVKDINPGSLGSYPTSLTEFNGDLLLSASNNLWKSDGTEAGTTIVKNIQGVFGEPVSYLTRVNNNIFFKVRDGTTGTELWKTDGTTSGTVLVKTINSGGFSYNYGTNTYLSLEPVEFNGLLFFAANNSTYGAELWKSDGTEAGTVLVKDINPDENIGYGLGSSYPGDFTKFNGSLFFVADDGVNGDELWKTDGTEDGTILVKDIRPGSNGDYGYASHPRSFTEVNNTLFFIANDGIHGAELWKTDGTEAGTTLVKDIYLGSSDSSLSYLTKINDTLFFVADDGTNGRELWKSDGTEAGTVLVQDIRAGNIGSFSRYSSSDLTEVGNTLFFVADDGINGRELWKSDGTEAGTVLIKDIRSGSNGSFPYNLTEVNGSLYFAANDGINGSEVWKSDSTEGGTVLLSNLSLPNYGATPDDFIEVNDVLFFTARKTVFNDEPPSFGTYGRVLWKLVPNSDPIAVDDEVTTDEETIFIGNVLDDNGAGNDSDPDGDPLTVTEVNGVATDIGTEITLPYGTLLTLNSDGTFNYAPNGQFEYFEAGDTATDSFTYTIDDGNGSTATATVTITINGADEPTDAKDDTVSTDEDTALSSIDVLANDINTYAVPLYLVDFNDDRTLGLVTLNDDGVFSYAPNDQFESLNAGETATDSFTYTLGAYVNGTDIFDTATVTVTITGVDEQPNISPVADDDIVSTDEDTLLSAITVLTNDTDADGDILNVIGFDDSTTLGLVTDNGDGTFSYDPNGQFEALNDGETAIDSFTYTISDGTNTDTATVTVNLTGVTDDVTSSPRVTDDLLALYTFDEGDGAVVNDTSGVGIALDLSIDDPNQVTWGEGSLTIDASTLIASTGPATKLIDGLTGASTGITLEAWITPENRNQSGPARIATLSSDLNNRNFTLGQKRNSYDIRLRTTATNNNGTPSVSTPGGSLTDELTHVVYTRETDGDYALFLNGVLVKSGTKAGDFSNWDEDYRFALGNELSSNRRWLGTYDLVAIYGQAFNSSEVTQNYQAGPDGSITGPRNTTPVAVADTTTTDEDSAITVDVLSNDTDADDDALVVERVDDSNTLGTVNLIDGLLTYSPNGQFDALNDGQTATDTFSYVVSDGKGGTDTATVTITIDGVTDTTNPNTAPIAENDIVTTSEDTAIQIDVLSNDTDPDSDTLVVVNVDNSSTLGTVNLIDGSLTYSPNGQFEALSDGQTATDTFSYTVSDSNGGTDTATVTITIDGVTDGSSSGRITTDLLALYTFDEGSGATVTDTSGVGTALDLSIDDPAKVTWGTGALTIDDSTLIASTGAASKLIDGLTGATTGMTLEAWVTPENLNQSGPARIATLSTDLSNRNFTLGQKKNTYDVRLRTTATNNNGTPSVSTSRGVLTDDLTHVIYTRETDGAFSLFVNGELVKSGTKGGNFSNWNDDYRFALGNELSGDRRWLGTYDLVAIYNQSFDSNEVNQNFLAGPDGV